MTRTINDEYLGDFWPNVGKTQSKDGGPSGRYQ